MLCSFDRDDTDRSATARGTDVAVVGDAFDGAGDNNPVLEVTASLPGI